MFYTLDGIAGRGMITMLRQGLVARALVRDTWTLQKRELQVLFPPV